MVFGKDSPIKKDFLHWKYQDDDKPFYRSKDHKEIFRRLSTGKGAVDLSPDKGGGYQDKDIQPDELPRIVSLGHKSYMIYSFMGSGGCVTIDIAHYKGNILYVKNFIDDVCTNFEYFLWENNYLNYKYDVLLCDVDHKYYLYLLH